jgi:putative transposase
MPHGWKDLVNQPQTEIELEAIRRSVARGQPYGSDSWRKQTATDLGLESTMRSRGRPWNRTSE